ncbi:uridine diphosphate-N-acetylglucosamine-binding protein YvcK [Micromonospora sp. 4G57]|uniref:Putative gluconeogenesis factor n=1 Tax=Micromonospora sicca TaxID=2202420 RepID=A0ABU5JI49_9ACTN|nr:MULTISPECIES: uridine diphosphate-N-acetylglucosamine-binding protein YvcK [unclassified Micromonospora]MDZ5442885.1 uridine diphosphate-N-acetylglucosamine-binding protein YvcK [Micromonospora sp. 4G57]MDZ5492297.1 uridine diphosphate-N-acetylglucosamine-binding protein YvcK [Micromonospora sp. 4G53]
MSPRKVVAFGGGHGLSASLRALRHCVPELDLDITAVVTVGDDGGSSGRLRAERGGLPPGDLRQALVALAGDHPATRRSAGLFQHRFAAAAAAPEAGSAACGTDPLAGHAVGNLVLCGLMELLGDPVAALDHAGAMLGAVGRVLPMSRQPVGIEARVRGADADHPDKVRTVRGQHQVAVTSGWVESLRLTPAAPAACAEAVTAVAEADWLIFGPGSWYTSVLPHLLVPGLAHAIVSSPARRLVTLNLVAEKETLGLSLADHLATLRRYLSELKVDVVLADSTAVGDPEAVRRAAESLGARLALAPVAVTDGTPRHDPAALGAALVPVLGADR